jgi:hypothetical protein
VTRTHRILLAGVAALAVGTAFACSPDPVHDSEVAALGGEDPSVPKGPLHRAGQPCLVCHGGQGPASEKFSLAGTIYLNQSDTTPLPNAVVAMVDGNDAGPPGTVVTNEVGNFYIPFSAWAPGPPIHDITVTAPDDGGTAGMISHIGRDGSCGSCHYGTTATTMTPGHVYLNPSQ